MLKTVVQQYIYLSQLSFKFLASHLTSILERSSLEKARNRTNYSCTFSQSERPNLLEAERQKSSCERYSYFWEWV